MAAELLDGAAELLDGGAEAAGLLELLAMELAGAELFGAELIAGLEELGAGAWEELMALELLGAGAGVESHAAGQLLTYSVLQADTVIMVVW